MQDMGFDWRGERVEQGSDRIKPRAIHEHEPL